MIKTIKIKYFIYLLVFCACNAQKAHLMFTQPNILLDSIKELEQKSFYARIKNTGDAPLIISKYNCSCECIVANFNDSIRVNPQDSIDIKLSVLGNTNDRNKWKTVQCTFKSNDDSIFSWLKITYFTK